MRTLRRAHPGWFEVAVFALAYAGYAGVRALTRGDVSGAVANAAGVLRLERRLDLAWEGAVQGLVAGRGALVDAVNAVYIWGHWPVLIAGGFLLYHFGRNEYRRLRTVILVSGALGLVIFAVFPVAPPRLAPVGLEDTVALRAAAYHSILVPSLVNEYAAMPSFHAGWNLLLGIELFRLSRNPFVRAFAIAAPVTMAFAVVATANHFVLDVIGGAVAVTLPLVALSWLDSRRQPRPAVACGKPATRQGGSPGCGAGSGARDSTHVLLADHLPLRLPQRRGAAR
jgi:membrane-associated phospholipid phosphatase